MANSKRYTIKLTGNRLPFGALSFSSKDGKGVSRSVCVTREKTVITQQQLNDLGKELKNRKAVHCGATIEDFLIQPLGGVKKKPKPAPAADPDPDSDPSDPDPDSDPSDPDPDSDPDDPDAEGNGGEGGQGDPPKVSTAKKKTASKK